MFASVAGDVSEAGSIAEARSAQRAISFAPRAGYSSVLEGPVGRWCPREVSSIGINMISVVELVVYAPPPRDASKAENFNWQVERASVEMVEGAFAKGPSLGSDQIFAKGVGKRGGEDGE